MSLIEPTFTESKELTYAETAQIRYDQMINDGQKACPEIVGEFNHSLMNLRTKYKSGLQKYVNAEVIDMVNLHGARSPCDAIRFVTKRIDKMPKSIDDRIKSNDTSYTY